MPPLSRREKQIFHGLCNGRPVKEIAAELGLARGTVGQYMAKLYIKLGVHSRPELTLLCTPPAAEKEAA